MTLTLRSKQNLEEFKRKNDKVVVMYSKRKCDACAFMRPTFDYIASKYASKVKLCVVYVEEVATQHLTFPTFEAFHHGKPVFQPVVYNEAKFLSLVKETIKLS